MGRDLEKRRAYNKRYHAAYYLKHREHFMLRRAFVDAARAGGCVDCGNKNLSVLQSDHVRGVKRCDIGNLLRTMVPLSELFAELDKCDTRCANCHQLATAERRSAKARTALVA